MKILQILSLMLLAACVGCSGPSKPNYPVADIVTTPVDLGEELVVGNPLSMSRNGDLLAITDNKSDSAFHIVDIRQLKYVGQFGRRGSGPGELGRIVLVSSLDDGFIIVEPIERRATAVKIDTNTRTAAYEPVFKSDSSLWFLERLANGNYITSEGYVDYRELFKIFSPDGKVIALTGDRQIPDHASTLPNIAVTAAYQYGPYLSPDRKKVLAMGQGESAGFYQVDGDTVALIAQFFNPAAEPDHTFSDKEYLGDRGTRPMGFVAAAASDNAVYILNSEVSIEDALKIDSGNTDYITGKVIYVYDWEGNRIGELHTDRRLRHITAPDSSGRMYALTEDGCDPTVVVFVIPEELLGL